MKVADWENPERSLELQQEDCPTDLLYDQGHAIAKPLYQAIPRTVPKPSDWNKIQAHTQRHTQR